MKTFCSLLLVVLIAGLPCGCGKSANTETPQPPASTAKTRNTAAQTQTAPASIKIEKNQELWVGGRRILTAHPHEGFTDAKLSPNRKWAIVLATEPFDAPGARAEQYGVLINMDTAERIDQYDLAVRFKLENSVIAFNGWNESKPATLKLLLSDGAETELDL